MKDGGLKLLQITDNGHGINVSFLTMFQSFTLNCNRKMICPFYANASQPRSSKLSKT